MVPIKNPQDFGASILFLAIGLVGLIHGQDLPFGTSASMGPGYFPVILGGLITLIGLIVAARSVTMEGPRIETIKLRPVLIILATILAFVFLIDRAGLATTTIIVAVMASFARRGPKLVEVFLLAVCLAVFAVGVFIYGLSLPISIWWG